MIPEAEVHKYSTDEFETVKILDPMTEERNALRYSLIPSLKMTYDYNKARNQKDISLLQAIQNSGFKFENLLKDDSLTHTQEKSPSSISRG